jgi:hypothetical protein
MASSSGERPCGAGGTTGDAAKLGKRGIAEEAQLASVDAEPTAKRLRRRRRLKLSIVIWPGVLLHWKGGKSGALPHPLTRNNDADQIWFHDYGQKKYRAP